MLFYVCLMQAWFSTNSLAQKYLDCVRDTYSEMSVTGEYPHLDYIKLRVIESQPLQHKKEDTVQFLRNFQSATVDFISQQGRGRPRFTRSDPSASGLLSHNHFLQQQKQLLHIVFGPPGVGKTSFSHHICSQFNSAPQSSSLSLVLLFFLREKRVAEAKSLSELLSCYGLPDDDLDHKELARLIVKNKGRDIQIIFDGLDERQELLRDKSFIVTRLLRGELKQAQIVVTSRPGIVTQLQWYFISTAACPSCRSEECRRLCRGRKCQASVMMVTFAFCFCSTPSTKVATPISQQLLLVNYTAHSLLICFCLHMISMLCDFA